MKYLIGFIFVLIIDFTVWALCKSASNGDKTIERSHLIKIRGDKLK